MTSARVARAERRHRPAEVAGMRRAHVVEERREPRAAPAVGVVGGAAADSGRMAAMRSRRVAMDGTGRES